MKYLKPYKIFEGHESVYFDSNLDIPSSDRDRINDIFIPLIDKGFNIGLYLGKWHKNYKFTGVDKYYFSIAANYGKYFYLSYVKDEVEFVVNYIQSELEYKNVEVYKASNEFFYELDNNSMFSELVIDFDLP